MNPKIAIPYTPCAALALLLVAGCAEDKPPVSNDIAALRRIVELPAAATAAKWEIFGTPEAGGVPGPTDFVTLVAELALPQAPAEPAAAGSRPYVVPNAERPWLTQDLRGLLARHGDRPPDPAGEPGCAPYATRIVKSGRVVDGFLCARAGKALLYLTLDRPG